MRVYPLKPDLKRYSTFSVEGQVPENFFWEFDGRSHAKDWKTITVSAADEDDAAVALPDFAFIGVLPAFNVPAVDVLLPVLRPNGELLPVRHRRAEYMLYNVTRVADALDEESSVVKRFSGTGDVMKVEKFAFRPEVVRALEVFRIPQLLRGHVFVTDPFVTLVEANGLTGFDLSAVWSV